MMLPTVVVALGLPSSCFAASGKGLVVAVFRRVFAQRRLRSPRERRSPAVGESGRGGQGGLSVA